MMNDFFSLDDAELDFDRAGSSEDQSLLGFYWVSTEILSS